MADRIQIRESAANGNLAGKTAARLPRSAASPARVTVNRSAFRVDGRGLLLAWPKAIDTVTNY